DAPRDPVDETGRAHLNDPGVEILARVDLVAELRRAAASGHGRPGPRRANPKRGVLLGSGREGQRASAAEVGRAVPVLHVEAVVREPALVFVDAGVGRGEGGVPGLVVTC